MAATLRVLAEMVQHDQAYASTTPGIDVDLYANGQPDQARAIVASLVNPRVREWVGDSGAAYRDFVGGLFGLNVCVSTYVQDHVVPGRPA